MKNINLIRKNNKGFTIVETLVAVAILMIAIAGPLTIAQKGLMAAVYARDQVTASFLAQDAMELIKNIRDYDANNSNWLNTLGACTYPVTCTADTYNGTISISPSDYNLYIGQNGYSHNNSGDKTQFTRKFYLENTYSSDTNNELTAVVMVEWKNGTISNVVTLKDQIFNIIR